MIGFGRPLREEPALVNRILGDSTWANELWLGQKGLPNQARTSLSSYQKTPAVPLPPLLETAPRMAAGS